MSTCIVDFSVYKPPEELRVDIDNEALKCAESWDVSGGRAAVIGHMSAPCSKSGCTPARLLPVAKAGTRRFACCLQQKRLHST